MVDITELSIKISIKYPFRDWHGIITAGTGPFNNDGNAYFRVVSRGITGKPSVAFSLDSSILGRASLTGSGIL
jgi:hypothetical protein